MFDFPILLVDKDSMTFEITSYVMRGASLIKLEEKVPTSYARLMEFG